jgi:glutaredoxin-like protein
MEVHMSVLSSEDRQALSEMFQAIRQPVKLLLVTDDGCQTCLDTQQILEEVESLSDQIHVAVTGLGDADGSAESLGLDRAPGLAILSAEEDVADFGIRYFGIPSGYEFSSLIQDIIMVGKGDSGLSRATMDALDQIGGYVHIQVFVTPTCPYCPGAVHLAHQMAYHSPRVKADMVEAIEFPDLAQRYGVMGVPRTVINDGVHVEGAVPEAALVSKIIEGAALPV